MPFLPPNQQRQSTEGKKSNIKKKFLDNSIIYKADTLSIGRVATIRKLSVPKTSLALFSATWFSRSATGTIIGAALQSTDSLLLSLSPVKVSVAGSVKL